MASKTRKNAVKHVPAISCLEGAIIMPDGTVASKHLASEVVSDHFCRGSHERNN